MQLQAHAVSIAKQSTVKVQQSIIIMTADSESTKHNYPKQYTVYDVHIHVFPHRATRLSDEFKGSNLISSCPD